MNSKILFAITLMVFSSCSFANPPGSLFGNGSSPCFFKLPIAKEQKYVSVMWIREVSWTPGSVFVNVRYSNGDTPTSIMTSSAESARDTFNLLMDRLEKCSYVIRKE